MGCSQWEKGWKDRYPRRGILITFLWLWPDSLLFLFPHKVRSYFWPRVLKLRINGFQQSRCCHSREMFLLNLLEMCLRSCFIELGSSEGRRSQGPGWKLPLQVSSLWTNSGYREKDSLFSHGMCFLLLWKHSSDLITLICSNVSTRLEAPQGQWLYSSHLSAWNM